MISAAPIRGMLAPYLSHFPQHGQGANQPQNPLRINCFTTLHCHPYLQYYLKLRWQGSNTISLYPNIGIGLNTNSQVFKCALTYTHSIAGQGFSLPYCRTSITSRQSHFIVAYALGLRFVPLSLLSCLCMSFTENTNSNSPGDWFNYLKWGRQSCTRLLVDVVPWLTSFFNRAGLQQP